MVNTCSILMVALAAVAAEPRKNLVDGVVSQIAQMEVVHEDKDGKKSPMGTLTIGLFTDELPKTTDNFAWACENHFANSIFHRVIPRFMAQGGDFTQHNGTGGVSKFGSTFADEAFIYKHSSAGALSMANRGPNTNGSQFFLTFDKTPWLDDKHVVFGCLADGMNVLREIESKGSPSGATKGKITIASCTVSKAPANSQCQTGSGRKSDL